MSIEVLRFGTPDYSVAIISFGELFVLPHKKHLDLDQALRAVHLLCNADFSHIAEYCIIDSNNTVVFSTENAFDSGLLIDMYVYGYDVVIFDTRISQ